MTGFEWQIFRHGKTGLNGGLVARAVSGRDRQPQQGGIAQACKNGSPALWVAHAAKSAPYIRCKPSGFARI
jgi:hypothetical protein